MKFNGKFELEGVTTEEVWMALSDPVMIEHSLPGCQYLVSVDDPENVNFDDFGNDDSTEELPMLPEAEPSIVADRALQEGETYAALVEIGVGSVKPSFKSLVTIDEREFPKMDASGKGNDSSNSFEMNSGMELFQTGDDAVTVEWWAEAKVFGRLAQMGQRVIDPVANRVVNRFFTQLENQLKEVNESTGLRSRIRDMV